MLTKLAWDALVLLAGSTMKDLPRNRGVQMGYKAYYPFIYSLTK
jgi:hypothetical protein